MKAFCAWAVVLPLWPCLAEECSDTVGSCSAKQASLMQFKSMSQKKQALSLEAQTSFSSKLAGFQKFTDEMVEKYGGPEEEGASKEPTPDVLQAVWTVLDFIEKMHSHLNDAHDDDDEEAKGCEDTEAACKSSYMNPDIMTEILTLKAAVESNKQAHTSCRDSATGPCQQICATNGLCVIYDTDRMTDAAKLPVCVNNPESAFSDDNIKAAEDSQELQAMEDCLDDTKTWLDFLYPKYDNCKRVETECEAKVLQCDQEQTKFQAAQCLYALESNLRCQQFKQCKDDQEQDCSTKCANIGMRSGARAADDETGQRLVCLLHTLFGEPAADYETGTNVKCPPEHDWTIQAETQLPCPDDPNVPCLSGCETRACLPSDLKALFDTVSDVNKSHFLPRPDASSRPARLEECKNQEIDTTYWSSITCPLESSPPSSPALEAGDVTQYSCPTVDVSSPCGVGFASEYSGFASVVDNDLGSCSDLARRGAQRVVDSCDNAGACIGSNQGA